MTRLPHSSMARSPCPAFHTRSSPAEGYRRTFSVLSTSIDGPLLVKTHSEVWDENCRHTYARWHSQECREYCRTIESQYGCRSRNTHRDRPPTGIIRIFAVKRSAVVCSNARRPVRDWRHSLPQRRVEAGQEEAQGCTCQWTSAGPSEAWHMLPVCC